MPRPIQVRSVAALPPARRFEPVLEPGAVARAPVLLGLDEAEALRLADVEGLYQEQVAARLGVSRPTAARILEAARRAVATAISDGRPLQLVGGIVAPGADPVPACPVHAGARRGGRRCHCGPRPGPGTGGDTERETDMTRGSRTGGRWGGGAGLGTAGRGGGWERGGGAGPMAGCGRGGVLALPSARPLGASFRVAIPTTDGVRVCDHMRRRGCFVVADVVDGVVTARREVRTACAPRVPAWGQDARGGGAGWGGGGRALAALDGVDVVLVGGAGRRALEDLATLGVRVEPARADLVDDALEEFLVGVRRAVRGPEPSTPE